MNFAVQFDYVGIPPINSSFVADTTQRAPLGLIVSAVDVFFGGGEFIYGKAGGTIAMGALCVYDNTNNFTACPNTANLGKQVVVAFQALTVGQFGWFQTAGQAALAVTASVAQGTGFGLTGSGTVGAITAGKQIENAVSAAASATTVVKAGCNTTNGSAVIQVPNSDGWFIGLTLSGTGVSGTITAISPDGRTVTASANATATGSVSVTGTYTGFIIASLNRPMAQGPIT